MRNITINAKNNTIEMTKVFANAAKRFGSEEYKDLQMARKDYPTFAVVVKKTSTKKDTLKGLTFDFMEKYIQNHDENGSIMNEYKDLRGFGEYELGSTLSYGEIKKWFLNKYPEIANYNNRRNELVA